MKFKSTLLITLLLVLVLGLRAQNNGSVFGIISDATTGEPLPAASIIIEGTAIGSVSNMEGNYRIMNVAGGDYNFVVSFIGYQKQTVKHTVTSGKSSELNISLKVDAVGLDEVVVSAQMMGQRAAINQQLNSDALTNVVSADKMKELPDVNAAEAIGRLPGVSVLRSGGEASKVVVRGLSPELTSVTINGVRIPATGSENRSVDLSMISPELLSNIELFKSPTADMDGDFIGGVVNLGVTKAPDRPETEVRLYGGYNSLKNSFGNYKGSVNISRRFFDKKLGLMLKGNYENTDRSAESIGVSWNKDNIDEGKVVVASMSITDEDKVIKRYGGSAQLDYQYNSGFVMAQALYSGRYSNKYQIKNNLVNAGKITHTPLHEYATLSTFQTLLSGNQRFAGIEADWRVSRSVTVNDKPYSVSMILEQYSGVEQTPEENSPEALNAKRIDNYADAQLEKYYFSPNISNHENIQAAVDFKYNFSLGDKFAGFLKFGGKLTVDDRIFDHNNQQVYWYYMKDAYINKAKENWPHEMQMTGSKKISLGNFSDPTSTQDIWGGKYSITPAIDFDRVDEWHTTQQSELVPVYNEENEKYTANEKVTAGYVMAKLKFGKIITLIPGVRYEKSNNHYTGHYNDIELHGETGSIRDTASSQTYAEILPSAHLKIKPLDWLDFRASVAKTLARPGYDMVAPRVRIDLNDVNVYQSNTELEHCTAWNYDVSMSVFSNKLGLLTVGGFYKKFDNFFTQTTRRMSSEEAVERGYPKQVYDVVEDYMNFDDSKVYGFELDLQTNFSYLPAPFNGLVLNVNATRLWSETSSFTYHPYEYYDRKARRMVFLADSSYYEKIATDLPNQVDWITNISLGYDIKGFSIRLSTIYQAAYLTGFSSYGNAETNEYFYSYVDDHLRFDASISQKIGKKLTLMANVSNITAEGDRRYTWKSQYVTSEVRYGTSFDIGLKYKF